MGKRINNKGFTIVELMIASAVFSVVLLLCATAIVQVGRMFYKGTIVNRTQTTTRNTTDDISQAIQFNSGSGGFFRSGTQVFSGVTVASYCFGNVRYSFAPPAYSLGLAVGQLPHILWKDRVTGSACDPVDITNAGISGGQEMLGDDMRLVQFDPVEIIVPPNPSGVWTVTVMVAYGATNDLFTDASFDTCVGSSLGGQFCSVSGITTNVIKRL